MNPNPDAPADWDRDLGLQFVPADTPAKPGRAERLFLAAIVICAVSALVTVTVAALAAVMPAVESAGCSLMPTSTVCAR